MKCLGKLITENKRTNAIKKLKLSFTHSKALTEQELIQMERTEIERKI
jgi:hypothetical protein